MATLRKTISPYDITSNDNPGSLLTQVQLKGENYDEWARALKIALRARKKFGFVDGFIERPDEESPDLEDWAELAECKQRGLTIVAYFGKLKKLWEELANFEQMPMCKCGLCTCNLGVALEKKREEEKAHQFLMGLDEIVYGTVRSNLLAQDPLPNLNRLYSTLVQEERVRIISRGKEERDEVMSFAVQAEFKSRNKNEGKDKNVVCNHCNRTRHESDSCFQLIGYPDWWGDRARGTGRGKGGQRGMTPVGRGRGGLVTPVGRGRGGLVKANATQVSYTDRSDTNGLSDEQWQTLLNILNNTKTGATEKLTGPHFEDGD
ncbi:hypothetical protein POPTR_013G092801v4 [Populus trichocarpa]|uniref:Uncharacterized protein n=1 Tax=Populus trichocarpa TaxID=3694 RepID=A0ACC0S407_POPTR|nr:hypothetical protein POPTR_013G092801v4 [Populus trichocarpa]